jgi:uncharacterized heparinase superfamily protein
MADRSTLRVAFTPLGTGRGLSWFKLMLKKMAQKPKITGFGQSIQSFNLGDEAQAFAMYAGLFSAAGETIETTAALVFDQPQASSDWQNEMHSLNWLQHFAASKRHLHSHYAIRMLARWARARGPKLSLNSQCKTLLALTTDGVTLARTIEPDLQREFLEIASKQAFTLSHFKTRAPDEAVLKSISILNAISAFEGLEALRKPAIEALETNIENIILADGGHISRRPEAILELLSVLLPLKQALKLERHSVPPRTSQAIDRMMAMLVTLRHGDGSLAFSQPTREHIRSVEFCMGLDDSAAQPLTYAHHSEIAHLNRGKLRVIANTKGVFEFECSDGEQRIFRSASLEQSQNMTRAQIFDGPEGLGLHQNQNDQRARTYFLSDTGDDLRIEDNYHNSLELIFELSPMIKLTALRESSDLLLVLPNRNVWKLSLRGAEARIEQNGQVLRLLSTGQGRINWALKRHAKSLKSTSRKKAQDANLLI